MAWTTPRTWAAADTPDDSGAFSFNTYVRDNLEQEGAFIMANAGSIVRASGSHALAEVQRSAAGSALKVVTGQPAWASQSTPALLATLAYNPSTFAKVAFPVAAALSDVDATNVKVTFTAPASQRVRIVQTAFFAAWDTSTAQFGISLTNGSIGDLYWGITEGSSHLAETQVWGFGGSNVSLVGHAVTTELTLASIGSGSHTYKFGIRAATLNASSYVGLLYGNTTTGGSERYWGPVQMEVWALP